MCFRSRTFLFRPANVSFMWVLVPHFYLMQFVFCGFGVETNNISRYDSSLTLNFFFFTTLEADDSLVFMAYQKAP